MNKEELTIVTAFFDCGRGEHVSQKRTNDEYINFFRFWARIQNKIIIYTTPEFEEKIWEVRKEFGLEDRTIIISDVAIWETEEKILSRMQEIEDKAYFSLWRYKTGDISNQARYSYVMLMKYWCLYDAAKKNLIDNNAAWIDFGWNHGGQVCTKEEEFGFLWKYKFDENKIHIFAKSRPEDNVGIINMQLMTDCIMGSLFILHYSKCVKLYDYVKEAMEALLSLDCFDDDQLLLLMSLKRHPEDFEVHMSDWFLAMKEYGGSHLTITTNMGEKVPWYTIVRENGIWRLVKKVFLRICYRMNYESYNFFIRLKKIIDRERP